MGIIGKVDSLWRYPVKSMCGEELEEVFLGFSGVYGDRIFALKSSACAKGFPYLTGRESKAMLRYRPRFHEPETTRQPPNLTEAEGISPGLNPVDCRPVSLLSLQTVEQLGEELGVVVNQRRFRANIYLDFESTGGFGEDQLVGRSLRIGSRGVISVLERDPRCKMVTLDPDSGESSPELLRQVAQGHDGMAGVYGAVLVEGMMRKGNAVELLDETG